MNAKNGFSMLIDGKLAPGSRTLDVIDPALDEVFASCACASSEDVERAVAAAACAFPGWSSTPLAERQQILETMAAAVEPEIETIAHLLTREQGKPLHEALAEAGGVVHFLRHYAGLDLPVKVLEDSHQQRVELHHVPLGVVAAIVPWNFPLITAVTKVGAALLAGNTVVLKPAPSTPLSTLKLGALFSNVVPAGVLNIITDNGDLGGLLTSHPSISKISFTGSTATGCKVMESSAATLKRLTLELGGNDSGIVLDDCDPATVATQVFDAAFANNGQVCVALKRLYVHDSQYEAVCDSLAALARNRVVGPGLEEGTQLGPVQNRVQYQKLKTLIAETAQEGNIIAGGDAPDLPGYFINPTIVSDIADDARLVREEQFGPVLPVLRYSDIDDAVLRANDSPYGLGNSIWTADPQRAVPIAAQLQSGSVWINKHGDVLPGIPFAGAKMSGLGVEMAEQGLLEFTQIKVVNYAK
ncbi:MAG: aldehyde dehydrogenase [Haliea sp.]|uniref:aldehyde dehydrogenase family protein n=2 Tax=Haliea TaxID=475794 RepID=UPI000C53E913|nr:aldehyde dehydrogenase family protein [Haliea sp.]MAD65823.1 aldehyde dehydrogenase [Haliea sp.]MBK39777.1 aldehyde dehydrogenase [Haliea sp.]MBP69003.1 aldehyde dehydrogenase [Haliea sp.]